MTQVIVHCIYVALRTPTRPNFGNDFSQTNPSGESLLRIVTQIFNASRTFPNQGEDPLNFLQRNILHAMFEDSQSTIKTLATLKLDFILEEHKDVQIPDVIKFDSDFNGGRMTSDSTGVIDQEPLDWYLNKDWKMFTVEQLKHFNGLNRLQTAQTWIQGGKVDSRDFYECIPHVSIMKIISELDKESSFGSIEGLLRKKASSKVAENQDSKSSKNSKEEALSQLEKLINCLLKVEIAVCALIASFTKKIKQTLFFYLTDFNQGPVQLDAKG